MSDYNTIKAAIGKMLRGIGADAAIDLIPTFIEMAEASIYRQLRRLPALEQYTSKNTDSAEGFITLPDDFLELRALHLDGIDPKVYLEIRPFRNIINSNRTGEPRFFARKDNLIFFDPKPDKIYSVEIYYYSEPVALSNASPNNYFSQYAPDLLIYGALREAAYFIKDEGGKLVDSELASRFSNIWDSKFKQAMEEVRTMAAQSEYSGSSLSVRIDSDSVL